MSISNALGDTTSLRAAKQIRYLHIANCAISTRRTFGRRRSLPSPLRTKPTQHSKEIHIILLDKVVASVINILDRPDHKMQYRDTR